ncbi:MAG: hypothetical protein LKG42_08445 [Eubacterium sp.]|nr:hypothetical protein [Eubacterium sp.]MCH4047384.1 hypothetical protein [Eubacterium sp.]MCH4080481.1 hypothetical protein [Eubacterium sp.]MCI1308032.1 hypothetical protein [Eubacterium sp.]
MTPQSSLICESDQVETVYYLAREQEGCRMSIIYSGPEGAALAETNEESEAYGVPEAWMVMDGSVVAWLERRETEYGAVVPG